MRRTAVPIVALMLAIMPAVASAQKTATTSASSAKGKAPTPSALYAAQTSPTAITLSWFAPYLPAKTIGEYTVVCEDDRPPRRNAVTAPTRPGTSIEAGRLLTYVVN